MNNVQYVPWDAEQKTDWIKAFFHTLKNSLLKPMEFFAEVAQGESFFWPLIYAIIIGVVVFIVNLAYQIGFNLGFAGLNVPWASTINQLPAGFFAGYLFVASAIFAVLVGMPALTTLGLLVEAALLHLCLLIIRSAKRDFKATFRMICYCMGPHIITVVPFVGSLVGAAWVFCLTIIGTKIVHETSYGRAILAVFLPVIFCCSAVFLFGATIAGGLFAAFLAGR
ncbi:MAG: YIP1 family protein [Pseudomonadota bacterium]